MILDLIQKPNCENCGMLRTTVIDTGCGIPLEKRDKLFRLFESIEDQKSTLITTSGIGLGLAICN